MDERNRKLEHRMLVFAAQTIRQLEQSQTLNPVVCNQLTRSASSIGANYAEACNASSKLDFRNKIFIAKKETAETRYWLDLCIELTGSPEAWQELRQEAHELLVILQTVVNTMKSKAQGSAK